jgi:hypothetical protein
MFCILTYDFHRYRNKMENSVHKLLCGTDRSLRKTRSMHNMKTVKGKDWIWKLHIQRTVVFGAAEYIDVGLA